MTYYTPTLISLDYARQHRRLATAETDDDALLLTFIQEASAELIAALQRVPMPYIATKRFSIGAMNGAQLRLRDDLLAVTALTNADSASVDSSLYSFRPDNYYPKHTIELTSASGEYWAFAYPEDRVIVAGTWGYVPHYGAGEWKQVTTLAEALTSGETDVDVTSATNISAGDFIKVGTHVMYVTAKATNTLTVETAQLGTTAAAHDTATAVYTYQQLPDIKAAVREMVAYYYKTKDAIGSQVTVFDGGSVQVQNLDPRVQRTIDRHKRKMMPLAV